MPIDRLVLIIVCVLAAAAATVYGSLLLLASTQVSPVLGLTVMGVIALLAYIGWRVVAERLFNKEDDHYDNFKN